MTVSTRKLMATCAVAALAVTIYGCSSSKEDRLEAERDEAVTEAAEAQMAQMMAEQRAAEAEAARMMAENAQMAAEAARAEADRLRIDAEEAAKIASAEADRLRMEAEASEQRAIAAESNAAAAQEDLRLAREALAGAEAELEVVRAGQMAAENAQMAAETARAEADRLRMEAEEAAKVASAEADRLRTEAEASEQRAVAAEMGAADAQVDLRLAQEALATAEAELEMLRAAEMMREQEEQARPDTEVSVELPGGIARSLASEVYAESDQDTLAMLLPDGETEFAPISVAVRQVYSDSGGSTRQPDLGAAYVRSISSDGANGFRVTYVVGGLTSQVDFTADHWNEQFGAFNDNDGGAINYWFWSLTSSFISDPIDRTSGSSEFRYLDMNGWSISFGSDNYEGHATYGLETLPENLPAGSAIYQGRVSANIWEGDKAGWPDDRTAVYGALTLDANFDTSQISGSIGELTTQVADFSSPPEPMPAGNSIDISNGVINGGQFTADWSGSGPRNVGPLETVSGFDGTLLGEFYGPFAEEVGGVISGQRNATGTAPDQYFTGAFGGHQLEPEVEQ